MKRLPGTLTRSIRNLVHLTKPSNMLLGKDPLRCYKIVIILLLLYYNIIVLFWIPDLYKWRPLTSVLDSLPNNSIERRKSPHCTANRLQYVRSSGLGAVVCKSCATHGALIMCNMSCCVPRGTKGQLSY